MLIILLLWHYWLGSWMGKTFCAKS